MLRKIIGKILIANNIRKTTEANIDCIVNMYESGYTLFNLDQYASVISIANDDYDIILKDGVEYLYYAEDHHTKYSDFIRIDSNIIRNISIFDILK